jgi:hypothetical protein
MIRSGDSCPECGTTLRLSRGPGRVKQYRGEGGYEIPDDLSFAECPHCEAEWLSTSQIVELSRAFEAQRERRLARVAGSSLPKVPVWRREFVHLLVGKYAANVVAPLPLLTFRCTVDAPRGPLEQLRPQRSPGVVTGLPERFVELNPS